MRALIYFGQVAGANGFPLDDSAQLANSLINHDFVALSLPAHESQSRVNVSADDLSHLFGVLELANRPVYMRVGLSSSPARTTAAQAVDHALIQMDTLAETFRLYNREDLLGGIYLNNAFVNFPYPDGSQLSRAHLNSLINAAHNTYNLPVAVLSDDPGVQQSRTTPPSPRSRTPAVAVAPSELGRNSAYQDTLIHLNPLFPWHLYDVAYPQLITDWSRLFMCVSVARATQTSNLRNLALQTYPFPPSPDSRFPAHDGLLGLTPDANQAAQLVQCAALLRSCGFTDLALAADTACGAISGTYYEAASYAQPLGQAFNDTGTWSQLSSDNAELIVRWTDPLSGLQTQRFSQTLETLALTGAF